MLERRVMILGEKENFLIRVLANKLKEVEIEAGFVPLTVNGINNAWSSQEVIILFMDESVQPPEDTLHFLIDKTEEEEKLIILIGESNDVEEVRSRIPSDRVYTAFLRPVDNAEFVTTVGKLFEEVEAGMAKKSILIVDDDPNYMGMVREWLKFKYKVAMANSGMQALKWLGKNKADLILLDHEMPVTTGPQVLEMLRSEEETKDIPVIFLTGKGDKQSVMAVVALKPEGYFLKTIQRNELLEKLDEFFTLNKV